MGAIPHIIRRDVLALVLLVLPLAAQQAEPNRIEFRKGSSTAVLEGSLSGRQDLEYAVTARSRQVLKLQLTASPAGSLTISMRDPGNRDLTLASNQSGRWSVVLPQDGDYEISVARTRAEAPDSTYKLKVTLR